VRLFFDENILRRALHGHDISFVEEHGWKGKDNGELLDLVEAAFDVLITSDANMEYQQHFAGRDLSVVVVPTNNLKILRTNAPAILTTLDHSGALDHRVMVIISSTGRRTVRRLDDVAAEPSEIDPTSPFQS
jgi:hypothetical protein